jgi:hypothetical protein
VPAKAAALMIRSGGQIRSRPCACRPLPGSVSRGRCSVSLSGLPVVMAARRAVRAAAGPAVPWAARENFRRRRDGRRWESHRWFGREARPGRGGVPGSGGVSGSAGASAKAAASRSAQAGTHAAFPRGNGERKDHVNDGAYTIRVTLDLQYGYMGGHAGARWLARLEPQRQLRERALGLGRRQGRHADVHALCDDVDR